MLAEGLLELDRAELQAIAGDALWQSLAALDATATGSKSRPTHSPTRFCSDRCWCRRLHWTPADAR